MYKLGTNLLCRSFLENDFRVLLDIKLQMSPQCTLVLLKASSILGCINRKIASRLKENFPMWLLRLHMSIVPSSGLPSWRKALAYQDMYRVKRFGGYQDCWVQTRWWCQNCGGLGLFFCFCFVLFVWVWFVLFFFPSEDKIKGRFYCCFSVPRAR